MTPRQFDWHLNVHGAAIGTWPPAGRAAALALLHGDARLQARLADALLAQDDGGTCEDGTCEDADAVLLDRMRRRVRAQVARRSTAAPTLHWSLRGGALAACLGAGLWAGGLWAGGLLDSEHDPLATIQVAALEALR